MQRSAQPVERERLDAARAQHHVTAQHQAAVRAEFASGQEQRITNRVLDLIVRELTAEFEAHASPPKVANPVQPLTNEVPFQSAATPIPTQAPPDLRATQAAALIERIDTFVKSQRPALALTLNNSLGARVEIEKLGPGRIAVKLIGQRGPPSVETVSRIRDELQARGLTVGALSVA